MEDAHRFSNSSNSDDDWESYEEDGEENESQIEAVETLLQQRDEGGLPRNGVRHVEDRRGPLIHNARALEDEDDDDESEDENDDDVSEGDEMDSVINVDLPSGYEQQGSDGSRGIFPLPPAIVIRGLESAIGRVGSSSFINSTEQAVSNPLLQDLSLATSLHMGHEAPDLLSRHFQHPQRSDIASELFQAMETGNFGGVERGLSDLSNNDRMATHSLRRELHNIHDNLFKNRGPKISISRWLDAISMFKVFSRPETCVIFAAKALEKLLPYALEQSEKVHRMRVLLEEEKTKLEASERENTENAKPDSNSEESISESNGENSSNSDSDREEEGNDSSDDVAMDDVANELPVAGEDAMMTIGGREVNVGSLGIDPTFLEALPEEMQEEVVAQHMRDLQESNRGDAQEDELVSTFLDVLPENVRRELLETDISRAHGSRSAATDVHSFFNLPSLQRATDATERIRISDAARTQDVHERRSALSPSVEVIEQQLSSFRPIDSVHKPQDGLQTKKSVSVATLHFVNKPGVAALARTLYLPQPADRRDILHELLLNLCTNKHSRADLINIILHVLQDASLDKPSLDRGFMHISNRARYGQSNQKGVSIYTPGRVPSGYNILGQDVTPNIVTQQFLEALEYLVRFSGNVKYFFVTEHAQSINRRESMKGKLKTKQSLKEQRYPFNILLDLLERQVVRENYLNIEMLSTIIMEVTKALPILLPIDVMVNKSKVEDSSEQRSLTENNRDASRENANTLVSAGPVDEAAISAALKGDPSNARGRAALPKLSAPPFIPDFKLKIIVDTLIAKECTSPAFTRLITVMQNMCHIPNTQDLFGQELVQNAFELSPKILHDLNDLSDLIQSSDKGSEFPASSVSKFSSGSSDQAKLLRVFTALDYLVDPSSLKTEGKSVPEPTSIYLQSIYLHNDFCHLWNSLSKCLRLIQERSDLAYIATSLLSLIESFMIVCKHSSIKDVELRENGKMNEKLDKSSSSILESTFFTFTDEHRKVLNHLVRTNPKLMNGSFAILIKNSKSLEFDNKRRYFNRQIYKDAHSNEVISLSVRRDQVFLDSYRSLYYKSAAEMKHSRLNIKFQGEDGVDAGGLTREWYQVLSRQIFNPDYALFSPVASDHTTFHPNRTSSVNPEHLSFFKFIGRIIGKAIFDNKLLDCHFSRAIYKRILGKSVSLKDMETLDLDYYKSLVWMLENDITDIITETFSIDADDYGKQIVIDLKPDGRNIPVTEENKAEYVKLVVEYKLVNSIKEQLNKFLEGKCKN